MHNRLFYGDPTEEMGGGRVAERRKRRERLEKMERLREKQLRGEMPTTERGTLPQLLCRPLTSTWREQLEELSSVSQPGPPSRPTTTQVRQPRNGQSRCCSGGLLTSISSPKLFPRLKDTDAALLSLNEKPYRTSLNAPRLKGSASQPKLAPTDSAAGAGVAGVGAAAEARWPPEMGCSAAVQHSAAEEGRRRLPRLGTNSPSNSRSTPNLRPIKFVNSLRSPPPKSISSSSRNLLTKAGLDKRVGLRRGVDFHFDCDTDTDDDEGVNPWNPSIEKIEILTTKQSKGESKKKARRTRRRRRGGVGWWWESETTREERGGKRDSEEKTGVGGTGRKHHHALTRVVVGSIFHPTMHPFAPTTPSCAASTVVADRHWEGGGERTEGEAAFVCGGGGRGTQPGRAP